MKTLLNPWSHASDYDQILFEAISMLYGHNEKLIHFLFHPDQPRLRLPSDSLKYDSGILSSGEQLLIRIGLDAWDGSGGIHFNELYQTLDEKHFQKMLQALLFLRSPEKAVLF